MLIPNWLPAKHLLVTAALAVAGYAGYWMRDLQADAAEGARLKAEKAATGQLQQLADQVSTNTAEAIGRIQITNRTIHQKAVHEVQTNTVYRDCRLPAGGVRHINDARAAANADGGTLPAAATAGR